MTRIYSNTRYRLPVIYARWILDVLCVLMPVGVFVFRDVPACLFLFGLLALLVLRPRLRYRLHSYILDEKNDLLRDVRDSSMSVALSRVSTVTYEMICDGEFGSLLICDSIGRCLNVELSRSDADDMVARILKINPEVRVDTEYPYICEDTSMCGVYGEVAVKNGEVA